MRSLSADEIKAIAGGLKMQPMTTLSEVHVYPPPPAPPPAPPPLTPSYPPPPSGGGSGGTSGSGSGSGGGHVAGVTSADTALTADVLALAEKSTILSTELNSLLGAAKPWTIEYGQDPHAAPGDSGTESSTHTIYIPERYMGNALATVEQLAHEVGHALAPIDYQPADYNTQSSYVTAVMNNEGGAQVNAIRVGQQIGNGFMAPGSATDVAAETHIYEADAMHYSGNMAIADSDVGTYMQNVSLGSETYLQYYTNAYKAAHPGK